MTSHIEIYNNTNSQIKLTVALPIYNSKKIAWLALESLIRQENINFDWELIVYEEIHSESVCPQLLEEYKENLINKNCKRIVFITQNGRPLLIEKWIEIGKHASESSIAYLLHAADCYSPKNRLKKSYEVIVEKDYDWYDQTKGYFYSFISNRIILYDFDGLTNLNMCLKTKFIKTLPYNNLKRGIDGYIYKYLKSNTDDNVKHFKDRNLYSDSIDTHGLNNISVDRENFFSTKPHIFKVTNLNLVELGLDQVLIDRIKNLSDNKKVEVVQNQIPIPSKEQTIKIEDNPKKQLFSLPTKPKKIETKPKNTIQPNSSILKPQKGIKDPYKVNVINKQSSSQAGKINK